MGKMEYLMGFILLGRQVFEPVIESNLKISAEEIETALIEPNDSLSQLHMALLKVRRSDAIFMHDLLPMFACMSSSKCVCPSNCAELHFCKFVEFLNPSYISMGLLKRISEMQIAS